MPDTDNPTDDLYITYRGRPALTPTMAVRRYQHLHGLTERAIRHHIARRGVPPITPPPISAHIPLYDREALDHAMNNRPGKGANRRRSAEA